MICINCKNEHQEKFCPNCGERSGVDKITFSSLFQSLFSNITNMEKGFLFNVKNLTMNANSLVNNYVLGKRKGIYNPLSYLILSITIFLIVDAIPIHEKIKVERLFDNRAYWIGYQAAEFMDHNFKYFWITSIVWLSIPTWLVFRKFNFAENLAINSFIIGHATLFSIIGLVLFQWPIFINPIIYITVLIMLYQVYKKFGRKEDMILSAILCLIIFFVLLMLLILGIGFIKTM